MNAPFSRHVSYQLIYLKNKNYSFRNIYWCIHKQTCNSWYVNWWKCIFNILIFKNLINKERVHIERHLRYKGRFIFTGMHVKYTCILTKIICICMYILHANLVNTRRMYFAFINAEKFAIYARINFAKYS